MFKPFISILALSGVALAPSAFGRVQAPTFEQYPVAAQYKRPAAPLRVASKQDREFRTRLAEASKQPVNFAGHYILTTIGCGASCVLTAVIDAKTGRVAWVPFSLCCWELSVSEPVLFRKDSDLIILKGQRNEGERGTYFVRFLDGRFQPITNTSAKSGQ